MSLKPVIEKIFKETSDYKNPRQATSQASSLVALSKDLYKDSKRFIYELLQNADDSFIAEQKVKVCIKTFRDYVVFAHNGKTFDRADLMGITGVNNGTKKNSPDKTGFKGIGFKSVFGQSKQVTILTDGEYFRFDEQFEHPWNPEWEGSKEQWEQDHDSDFIMPWQLIPIYTEPSLVDAEIHDFLIQGQWPIATIIKLVKPGAVQFGIKELSQETKMYLFLKHINSIEFDAEIKTQISISSNSENRILISKDAEVVSSWLVKTILIPVPERTSIILKKDDDFPKKLKEAKEIEITLAAKLESDEIQALQPIEQLLYAYLPTDEKKFNIPVLVNAAFYTIANREDLHVDAEWNQLILGSVPAALLQWVAELAQTRMPGAYNILPESLNQLNALTRVYNDKLCKAFPEIAFIVSDTGVLLKINESLIDTTNLSLVPFIGKDNIRNFMIINKGLDKLAADPFVSNDDFSKKLRKIGVASFEWLNVPELLKTESFQRSHTIKENTELIQHFKILSTGGSISAVKDEILKEWHFIFDHLQELKAPRSVFFPVDATQGETGSEVSFIHPDIEQWLGQQREIKLWLEGLGVVEKSDLTFLDKTILPVVAQYSTIGNALHTLRRIFSLYLNNELSTHHFTALRELKLLTKGNILLSAKDCFFSDLFRPRMPIEGAVEIDVFVSETYIDVPENTEKWKGFLLAIGVNEGIGQIRYPNRTANIGLVRSGFDVLYFDWEENKFKPAFSIFTPKEYAHMTTLSLLDYTIDNHNFAKLFWNDVLKSPDYSYLFFKPTAFWGRDYKPSYQTGTDAQNYLSWYVQHKSCIPTTMGVCRPAREVFINDEEIVKIAGKYLPVFDGSQLDTKLRGFFGFKSKLLLKDYLSLLTAVSLDRTTENKNIINLTYDYLLDAYDLWDQPEYDLVTSWAQTGLLATTNGNYTSSSELKYFADGDPEVFGDRYQFIRIGRAAKRHSNLEKLLDLLGIEVLKQSEFDLQSDTEYIPSPLANKLSSILPYWAKWMEKERQSGYEEMFYELSTKLENLEILQGTGTLITYGDNWSKKVNTHYDGNKLYINGAWDREKVLHELPLKLVEIFQAKNYERELIFLIRSNEEDIREYFSDQGIDLPEGLDKLQPEDQPTEEDFEDVFSPSTTLHKSKDYNQFWAENVQRNQEIIKVAGSDGAHLLKLGIAKYAGESPQNVFHFTHIENAVSIIMQGEIKSRQNAVFADSAGSGIIAQTGLERKQFARFYFRTKTPTQYYIENLGRGAASLRALKSDPVCPVPVFFVIPLADAMNACDWNISIGSLASNEIPFGNDIETIGKFDFEGLRKNMPEITKDRFLIAAHQEFLAKESLDLSKVNYHLVVQNQDAKRALIIMLNEPSFPWDEKILVNPDYYRNENPRNEVKLGALELHVNLAGAHNGYYILQHDKNDNWTFLDGKTLKQYQHQNIITMIGGQAMVLHVAAELNYSLFYIYNGRIWLIDTTRADYEFNSGYILNEIQAWMASTDQSASGLLEALKTHPELAHWYAQQLPGPDHLTLETHTRKVIENYQNYFLNKQMIFGDQKEFLLCLALHDIGKPLAVLEGDKEKQHERTLEILERIRGILPIRDHVLEKIKVLINGDPIGKYLNPYFALPLEDAEAKITEMVNALGGNATNNLNTLIIYYQSDSAGYQSLRDRIFITGEDDLRCTVDGTRIVFNEEYEQKFCTLIERVKLNL